MYGVYAKKLVTPLFPKSSVLRALSVVYCLRSDNSSPEKQGTLKGKRHDPKIITESIGAQSIIFGFQPVRHSKQL